LISTPTLKRLKYTSTWMRALTAQLTVATSAPTTNATVTDTMMTVVTIGTVAAISQKGPRPVGTTVAD